MDGSLDGSVRKVKMDHSAMWAAIGKHESRVIGKGALIFLANLLKIFSVLPKGLDLSFRYFSNFSKPPFL